jgi:OmpA-OmpF porin, OOP family
MKQFLFIASCLFTLCSIAQTSVSSVYTSKFDFVPGEKVIASEDFSAAKLGDFPEGWKTNATAEVVTVAGKPGKWMKINKEGVWFPEFIKSLPQNFTLEFDLGVNPGWNSMPFVVNFANLKTPKEYLDYYHFVNWKGVPAVHVELAPAIIDQRPGRGKLLAGNDGNHEVNSEVEYKAWDNQSLNFAHVAMWRQDQRLRVYLNGEKIWDVQELFDPAAKYNAVTFAMQGSYELDDFYLLGDIRLAAGAPDTRNKLLNEGKFIARGIRFQSGSAEITPDSYGLLKELAAVVKDVDGPVTIIGHTDADGDAQANILLSKERATAVKDWLVNYGDIDAGKLLIDGKGASVPIDANTTTAGKANNRRVEIMCCRR